MPASSSAYDFGMFEPKRRIEKEQKPAQKNNVIELPKEKLEENRRPKRHLLKMVPTILSFLIIAGMSGAYVLGQVQLAELTDSLEGVSTQLSEDQSVYTQMKMKSEAQMSLQTVEDYATGELGMEKVNRNQIKNITLSDGDKSQVLRPVQDNGWFSELIHSIRRFLS